MTSIYGVWNYEDKKWLSFVIFTLDRQTPYMHTYAYNEWILHFRELKSSVVCTYKSDKQYRNQSDIDKTNVISYLNNKHLDFSWMKDTSKAKSSRVISVRLHTDFDRSRGHHINKNNPV